MFIYTFFVCLGFGFVPEIYSVNRPNLTVIDFPYIFSFWTGKTSLCAFTVPICHHSIYLVISCFKLLLSIRIDSVFYCSQAAKCIALIDKQFCFRVKFNEHFTFKVGIEHITDLHRVIICIFFESFSSSAV